MLLRLPLVRKGRRFFIAFSQEMENRIMKKTFKDHGYESLLLFGEPAQGGLVTLPYSISFLRFASCALSPEGRRLL